LDWKKVDLLFLLRPSLLLPSLPGVKAEPSGDVSQREDEATMGSALRDAVLGPE